MKSFLDDNFLLQTKTAEYLYHEHAAKMPIIDYHSHLIPQQIAENASFENITQAWLYGDHYKWRAMRANGVDEKYCSGDTSDWGKFDKWAETVPYTLRNPLYHWTHLELKRYFGISDLLNKQSAKRVYEQTECMFKTDEFKVQGLIDKMNVELICTTDDPVDALGYHKQISQSNCKVDVRPTWRPDKAMAIEMGQEYIAYVNSLSEVSDINISSYPSLLKALKIRHDYFHSLGCRLSDHGLEYFFAEEYTSDEIESIFSKALLGIEIKALEILKFKSAILHDLAVMNHEKQWTQQFHIGAIRNNNTRLFNSLGPDTGFDSMGDFNFAQPMSRFLDRLDKTDQLAKTILYNLNPKDNEVMATMIGNFQDGSVVGKMQWGSGWWFLDQKNGMEKQLNTLSTMGLLSRFVGMLTDSRSFLSFPRHEYFRRILCNLFGNDVENGELPNDMNLIGATIEDICYNNAKNYLKF